MPMILTPPVFIAEGHDVMVFRAIVPPNASLTFWANPESCRWVPRRDLAQAALPSVMRKIIAHALKEH